MTAWAMFVQERLGRIQSPGSPLYWPYVVSAAAIAVLFLKRAAGMTVGDAVRAVASPHVWLTRSTLTDVVMTLAHETLVAVPTLALGACVSNGVLGALGERAAGAIGASGWTAPLVVQSAAVTLAMMLAIDLGTFVAHRLHHAVPFLWEIHAVHHSAEQLTLFTAHRLHPLEALLRAAVQGVCTGCALFALKLLFGHLAPAITVWGLGVGFFVHMFTNNLLHSHVPVRYPRWLRPLVLSPHVHQLHHSRLAAHRDRNFGAVFPYWDRLCGTYLDIEVRLGELAFGLDAGEDPFKHSLVRCYLYPLAFPVLALVRKLRGTSPASVAQQMPARGPRRPRSIARGQ
ncbi:MAG TPA: sterol desaturase family protein [Polyangiaceae bacterium]|nr:sterol desaturase family protein [Polyangiaceae bacterium]